MMKHPFWCLIQFEFLHGLKWVQVQIYLDWGFDWTLIKVGISPAIPIFLIYVYPVANWHAWILYKIGRYRLRCDFVVQNLHLMLHLFIMQPHGTCCFQNRLLTRLFLPRSLRISFSFSVGIPSSSASCLVLQFPCSSITSKRFAVVSRTLCFEKLIIYILENWPRFFIQYCLKRSMPNNSNCEERERIT